MTRIDRIVLAALFVTMGGCAANVTDAGEDATDQQAGSEPSAADIQAQAEQDPWAESAQASSDENVATTEQAMISRHCRAYYQVEFLSGHSLPYGSLQIGTFHAEGGCGNLVPNRCRERAREKALACMQAHWARNWRSGLPSECTNGDIEDYNVANAREYVKGEVCDFIRFNGNVNPTSVTVKVTGRSVGNNECGGSTTLHQTLDINCNTLSLTQETPVVLTSTTIGHKPEADPGFGYVKREKVGSETRNISLHRTEADANKGLVLRNQSDTTYVGCGRKAAQNALRFFSIDARQSEVADWVDGHSIPGSGGAIATYPSELRQGLQGLIDYERGSGLIDVDRYSGKSQADIVTHILRGYPVIALVEDGTHWVTVVGMKHSRFTLNGDEIQFIVHDNASTEVWPWASLSLDFDNQSSLWSSVARLLGGGTSYLPGTIIVFNPPS